VKVVLDAFPDQDAGSAVGFTIWMVCAVESVASYLEVVFVCEVRLYQ